VKRVLVTGASGFIGRHTIKRLVDAGFEVHAVSRRSQPMDNGHHWHCCDLLEPAAAADLIRATEPTHLLHLAWYAEPGAYSTAPENLGWVEASLRLLRAFARPDRRAVVAGTCAEYDWSFGFCSERVTPLRPTTLYGECKRSISAIAERFASEAGLSLAWGRIFFVYGPGEHQNRLVASVVRSLVGGEPALCTTGTQVRDYLHVADVASAFVRLLDSDVVGAVNVGSGEPLAVRQLLSTIGDVTGAPQLIRFGELPTRPNEPPLLVADARRLFDEVGWRPSHTLRSGISDTVDWWTAQLASPRRRARSDLI